MMSRVLRGGDNFEVTMGTSTAMVTPAAELLRRGAAGGAGSAAAAAGTALPGRWEPGQRQILGQRQAQTGRQNGEQHYGMNGFIMYPSIAIKIQTTMIRLRGGVVARSR